MKTEPVNKRLCCIGAFFSVLITSSVEVLATLRKVCVRAVTQEISPPYGETNLYSPLIRRLEGHNKSDGLKWCSHTPIVPTIVFPL